MALIDTDGDDFSLEAWLLIFVFISGVVLSELFVSLQQPQFALSVYFVVLAIAALVPPFVRTEIPVFQGFALVAAFRIIDLGFPQLFQDVLFRTLFVYVPVFAAVSFMLYRSEEIDTRFNSKALLYSPAVLVLGGAMAVVEFAVLQPPSFILDSGQTRVVFFVLIVGVWIALTEELLFRGLLQRAIGIEVGPWTGRVVASVVFGVLHAGYAQPLEVGVAIAFGFVYAILYDVLEDITTVVLLHSTINILLFGFIPLYRESIPLPV